MPEMQKKPSTPTQVAAPAEPLSTAAKERRRLIAVMAVVLVAALLALAVLLPAASRLAPAALSPAAQPAAFAAAVVEPAQPTPDHDAALGAMMASGLPGSVTFRDWGVIDNDAVLVNGLRIPAVAAPQTVTLPPGAVSLVAEAGTEGCISLEIGVPAGPTYTLCLPPGSTNYIPVK